MSEENKVENDDLLIEELEIVELEDRLEFASAGRCDSASVGA